MNARCLAITLFAAAGCVGAPTEPATQPATASLTETTSGLSLDAESARALAEAPVAVLLFPPAYRDGMQIMAGPSWAAVSARGAGIHLNLHATNQVHGTLAPEDLAALPPANIAVRGEAARTTVNELIRSVAWQDGDVAYALEVECSMPETDPRCVREDFVIELADALVPASRGVVGGGR